MLKTTFVEYDQGDAGGQMYVFVECTACPDGAQVSFASRAPLPDGSYVELGWTNIVGCNPSIKKHFIAGATFNIPARWKTTLTYNYKSNGKAPLPGEDWNVEIKAAFHQPPEGRGKELLAHADHSEHAIAQAHALHNKLLASNDADAAIGPGKFIGIGSHKTAGKKWAKLPVFSRRGTEGTPRSIGPNNAGALSFRK